MKNEWKQGIFSLFLTMIIGTGFAFTYRLLDTYRYVWFGGVYVVTMLILFTACWITVGALMRDK